MSINFTSFPAGTLVPGAYVEVDSTQAEQGPSIQPYQILVIGQRLSTGSKIEGELVTLVSGQEDEYFGPGAMITQMLKKTFDANKATQVWAVALDDDGAAAAATGDVLFAGTSTEAGTIFIHVSGRRYKIGVGSTDTAATIATAVVAEITADVSRGVDVAVNGGVPEQVDFTARNLGEAGNDIDIRFNYFDGETLPAGITETTTGLSGGTANPDIAIAIAALTEDQYNIIISPYNDAANLTALDTEMDDRFGPIRQNFGVTFIGKRDTYSNLVAFGAAKNSKNFSVMGTSGPHSPWEWAAQTAGITALAAQNDSARPFQTLELTSILAPTQSEVFSWDERQILLENGISTYNVVVGNVVIESLITTYQKNNAGVDDTAFRYVNTLLTLEYYRYDLRRQWLLTYPRAKLANDGVKLSTSQGDVIVTPKTAKAFIVGIYAEWVALGLAEDLQSFKRDVQVERDVSNPNRLNSLIPANTSNQLRVSAFLLQFRL